MVHSSASDSSRRNSSEISWYYIQPGFKLIDAKKCAWAFAFFVFILFVISRFSHSLIFDSPWALLIVPGVAAFVIWLMLVMQPHRQVYYRLDQDGVFCEYRSSASALTSFLDLILSLLGSIIKLKNTFYINKHSSRSRMIKKILGIAVLFGLMMTAAQAKTFLVDVRTPSEIATTGKVEGALVANYSAPDFVDQFKALGAKPDDDIELYCRAEMASQILSKLGYKNIRNLGGYEAAAETLKRPLVK